MLKTRRYYQNNFKITYILIINNGNSNSNDGQWAILNATTFAGGSYLAKYFSGGSENSQLEMIKH